MIDFVITWVNGDDPKWKRSFNYFSNLSDGDKRVVRYRDWELLRYWFRGVEKFAPWVRNVYFVTEGHIPNWLNTSSPKLKIVKHSDFIPQEYLPLFNSRAIEVNIHRISGLSEHFVYFNDDFFLVNSIESSYFFRQGLPCDIAVLNAIDGGGISDAILEALAIINQYFAKRKVLSTNLMKWFNWKYGKFLFRTLFLLPWPRFTGFYDPHLPIPFLKSTFLEVWEKEETILLNTSKSKFRSYGTVNPYIFRYWQLLTGKFYPINPCKKAEYVQLSDDNILSVVAMIRQQKKSIIILNDSVYIENFEECKKKVKQAFAEILPTKSNYEI